MTSSLGFTGDQLETRVTLKHCFLAKRDCARAYDLSVNSPAELQRQLSRRYLELGPASRKETEYALAAVIKADRQLRGRYCLQRSLAAFLFSARLYARKPTLIVGARIEPFIAHAWLEADGQVVGEQNPGDYLMELFRL